MISHIKEYKLKEETTSAAGTYLVFNFTISWNGKELPKDLEKGNEKEYVKKIINGHFLKWINDGNYVVTLKGLENAKATGNPELNGRYSFGVNATLDENNLKVEIDDNGLKALIPINIVSTDKKTLARDKATAVARNLGKAANTFLTGLAAAGNNSSISDTSRRS